VTLFRFSLRRGQSIFDQVVFAATKAFLSGEFRPGQAFPSVRTLAAEFKIHPNTAHKVQLVVEAMRVGVDLAEVLEAVETQWARIEKPWR
jgi:DNA-binding transcriptional regulator YhcF (GntR family)